ncbi:MAG: DMT family transporter [Candidatus Thermoplasmatota archaeon]
MDGRRRWLGIGMALTSAILFGAVNAVAKDGSVDPLVLTGLTYVIAGLVALPFATSFRPERRDLPILAAMAATGGFLAPAALFFGLQSTAASDASLLLTADMLFTVVLARVALGERPGPRAMLGIGLLFVAAVAIAASAAGDGESTLGGVLLVLLAALGWAIDNVLGARLMGRHKAHHLLVVKGLGGGALALGLAIALGHGLAVPTASWPGILFIGVLGIGASAFAFYVALGAIGAARASAILWPAVALTGVAAGAILLHEPLTWVHGLAGALVVAGVLLVARGVPATVATAA